MIPYTYLIGWSKEKKFYYGVRYSSNCNPNDLWKKYFTSSKHVKEFRKKYGEPDIIQIRKIFTNKEAAVKWENKVLRRMNVVLNEQWLNKNDLPAPPVMKGKNNPFYGKKHSQKVMKKMKKNKSEEQKKKFRKPKSIIKTKTKKHKENIRNSHYGKNHNKTTKNKLRIINEKYEYKIKNIDTEEMFFTKNLTLFCEEHKSCNKNNLVKTYDGYSGKKRMNHSGRFKIMERIDKRIKISGSIYCPIKKSIIEIDDIYQFCKYVNINVTQLLKTLENDNKTYTVKGYYLIKKQGN